MGLPSFVFESRRARVKASLPEGTVAIVAAHAEVTRSRDSDYPFRQSSDFWYLTGFLEPDAVLILRQDTPDCLVVRPNDPEAEVWTGRRLGPERVHSRTGGLSRPTHPSQLTAGGKMLPWRYESTGEAERRPSS